MSDQTKVEQKESGARARELTEGNKRPQKDNNQEKGQEETRNKKEEKQREHTKENPMPKTAGAIFETCKLEL